MAATSWADPGLLFPNTKGKIRRRDSVMRSLRHYLEEAGLPVGVRFHDLRHTASTLALRQGVPLHTVSKMLGHSDPAMTLTAAVIIIEPECGRCDTGTDRERSGHHDGTHDYPWVKVFDPRCRRYAHVLEDMREDAARAMDELF